MKDLSPQRLVSRSAGHLVPGAKAGTLESKETVSTKASLAGTRKAELHPRLAATLCPPGRTVTFLRENRQAHLEPPLRHCDVPSAA